MTGPRRRRRRESRGKPHLTPATRMRYCHIGGFTGHKGDGNGKPHTSPHQGIHRKDFREHTQAKFA